MFTRDLMIWGSDAVILKWIDLRSGWSSQSGNPTQTDPLGTMRQLEELVLLMRRDIGYPDTELPAGSLLRLFINDLDRSEIHTSDPGLM